MIQVLLVIQAFAAYLRLVNLAEKVHRLRRRRVYLRAQVGAQPGSLEFGLGLLRQQGVDAKTLVRDINALRIQPVFTAHPTEAVRRTLLTKEQRIARALLARLDRAQLTGAEHRALLETVRDWPLVSLLAFASVALFAAGWEAASSRGLDNLTVLHDNHTITKPCYDSQVMSNENQ